jgi:prepilin-type N-terminal cleavage/methylation domain-containing protein
MARQMRGNRGFTLLELVVVLAMAGVLATIVVATFGGVMDRVTVRSAQTEFLTMLAQTRTMAIERGQSMLFDVNATGGIVQVEVGCTGAGAAVITRNFMDNFGVTMVTDTGVLSVCMTARGYANTAQNSFSGEAKVAFVKGERALAVTVLPLGQAVRQ